MMYRLAALLFAVVIAAALPARAAELATPAGPVILTVHGKIGHANRGPFNAFDDAFFKSGDVSFDRAAVFDRAMLEKLGMHSLTVKYDSWPKPYKLEGPLLRDVLKAAGATGTLATVYALDGYGAKLPLAELEQYPVVLALKADGRWLGLGGRGPAWVVYPRDQYPALKSQDDAKWVWSAIRIEVE